MRIFSGINRIMEGEGGNNGGGGSAPDFASTIPEAYRDKPYLKDVDSFEKLYSKFDGAQQSLGQKEFGIPDVNAGDEIQTKFYNGLKPTENSSYVFVDVDGMPDALKRDDASALKVKELFHTAGLSTRQAKLVQQGYDKMLIEGHTAQQSKVTDSAAELDAEFDALANTTFGETREADLEGAQQLLAAHAPQNLKDHIEKMPNKDMVLLAAVLKGVRAKYITEDSDVHSGNAGGLSETESIDQKLDAIQKELATVRIPSQHKNYKDLSARGTELWRQKVALEQKNKK